MHRQTRIVIASIGLLGLAFASLAQHQGHQMGTPSTTGGSCQANAKEGLKIVESANRQLEEARQTNSPQQMRAAMNDLQSALGEVRTQLSLCVSPAAGSAGPSTGMDGMEGMDHSAMEGMPGMDSKPSSPPDGQGNPKQVDRSPMVMDHSKMTMPGMNATPKAAAPTASSPGGKQASQAAQANSKDPVCGMEVGTRATETATYQGKTYYFCSRADKEKFLSDPTAYLTR